MRIIGIETSCDETGIAIYDDEQGLLSHQLYSQVKLHADYEIGRASCRERV